MVEEKYDPSKGIGIKKIDAKKQEDLGKKIGTTVVHAGEAINPITKGVVTPIDFSTTYAYETAEAWAEVFYHGKPGFAYSRHGNPTRSVFEGKIAILEHGEAGIGFSSGMAAISSAICTFIEPGDEIVVTDRCYPGTRHLLNQYLKKWGFKVHFVNATKIENVAEKINKKTKIVHMECPANPTLSLCDIEETVKLAKEVGAKYLFDNTFASPINQNPIDFGADVVIHSVTKYLGGHSDILGGAIVTSANLRSEIMNTTVYFGGVMAPFDAWLTIRGIKTLELRVKRHNENAIAIAEFLEDHPKIREVHYPGLKSHPQYELAKKQMMGFGGMVSFCVGKSDKDGGKFLNSLKIIKRASSLGSVQSLAQASGSMIYLEFTEEEKRAIGINPGFIRFSTGIEDKDDLIEDIDQALETL
ncbi:MAG TPA: aminotransferase class I/II-fold pyridoxal phosphate-dependent enzyme [candidate division Zixibacteria bacterium]|nr:aminotransferase class I/II-fold pyridoxal phosphate-dependent enzyme [candidate division Zixibacteria bacterium]